MGTALTVALVHGLLLLELHLTLTASLVMPAPFHLRFLPHHSLPAQVVPRVPTRFLGQIFVHLVQLAFLVICNQRIVPIVPLDFFLPSMDKPLALVVSIQCFLLLVLLHA